MTNTTPARVQPGTPDGGQFATDPRDESDVTLVSKEPVSVETTQRLQLEAASRALAAHVRADVADVETSFDNTSQCGRTFGHATVRAEVAIPGDPRNTTVTVIHEVTETGDTVESAVRVEYDVDEIPGAGWTRSSVSVETRYAQRDQAEMIDQALEKAHLQLAADAEINDPQYARNAAPGATHSLFDIVRLDVVEGGEHPVVEITDNASGHGSRPRVRLTLDGSTGAPVSGQLDTAYGLMDLEGDNLGRATTVLHRDLSYALEQWDQINEVPSEQWSEMFTARMAKIFSA